MMAQRMESVRRWVCRLWAVSAVQEAVESWTRAWLVEKFRSPYMCRVSVRDGRWCMVPSLTHVMMSRLPSWKCVYDPWCDNIVHIETSPPLVTRLTVLTTALTVSLLLTWAPRILTYRPSRPCLLWVRHNTPRRVLVLVAVGAILQLLIDHWLLFLMLPPYMLLSRIISFATFCCATLIMTAVLVVQLKLRAKTQLYHTRPLSLGLGIAKTTLPQPKMDTTYRYNYRKKHSTDTHYIHIDANTFSDEVLDAAHILPNG